MKQKIYFISGNYTFEPAGTPNLKDLMFEVAKMVENPRLLEDGADVKTIYDNMVLRHEKGVHFPGIGSGSDFAPFLQQVGASVVDLHWKPAPDVGGYPVYHSVYETFELVEKYVDPGFIIHRQTAIMAALGKKNTKNYLSNSKLRYFSIKNPFFDQFDFFNSH